MPSTPRRWGRMVGQAVSLGLAVLAFGAAPFATASAAETSCGLVVVHTDPTALDSFWSMNLLRATGVGCPTARALVRDWDVAVAAGRIPGRVTLGAQSAGHLLLFGRFGPPYGFEGLAGTGSRSGCFGSSAAAELRFDPTRPVHTIGS